MRTIIFYFSGTGNSYYAAKRLAEIMGETEISSLATIESHNLQLYETIGVVYPVYYIHAPALVLQYLQHLKAARSQRLFTLATHGGSLGYALYDAREILRKNNIEPQEFRLKMPGNYILEYGALPMFYQNFILKNAEQRLESIAKEIEQKTPAPKIEAGVLARASQKIAEKKLEKFGALGTQFFANHSCNHCNACIKICPSEGRIGFFLRQWELIAYKFHFL